jgi:hypothetical protein
MEKLTIELRFLMVGNIMAITLSVYTVTGNWDL